MLKIDILILGKILKALNDSWGFEKLVGKSARLFVYTLPRGIMKLLIASSITKKILA